MYGMVNQTIKDFIISHFGEDEWIQICKKVGIPNDDFVFMQYYPDKLTENLIQAASKQLSLSDEIILNEIGRHWVLYTAKDGYDAMKDIFGSDYKSCLQNLNNLHARMEKAIPHLTPPRFFFREENEKTYYVSYFAKRFSLWPMVVGLLEGLATKYGMKVFIECVEDEDNSEEKIFRIDILE